MPEKHDFSKIEDRKKFKNLPKEEQDVVVGEAQEEASLINEIVGKKGSREDYKIITKLAEEEIISKKEIEILKEKYNQRLDGILNSQLTVENIETFADNALTQTTNLVDDILSQYQKYKNKIEPTASDNAEQENQALVFFELPDIPNILQSIIEVKEKIDNLKTYIGVDIAKNNNVVITPPDNNKKINDGNRQGIEQKRMFPRLLTLLYIIEHDFDILPTPTDTPITRGIVTPDMVRQTTYVRVEILDLDRAVYLCDEEGNVSYVFDTAKISEQNITLNELDLYTKEDKNSLISSYPGIGIRIRQTNVWRNNITAALKEPISEASLLKNVRQISEFRREKGEYLPFEDFQREVRNLYSQEGNVATWYRQEQKNHSNWPSHPDKIKIYKDKGWKGWSELVGKENRLKKVNFEDFQREVISLYSGEGDVQKWYHLERENHSNWPSDPYKKYKDKGWEGFPELVGKENQLKKGYLNFEDFQREVKNLYFVGRMDAYEWYKKEYKNHPKWPSHPDDTYKDNGWEGFPELVGKENRLKKRKIST